MKTEFDTIYLSKSNRFEHLNTSWHKLHEFPVGDVIAHDGNNISKVFGEIKECGLIPDFKGEFATSGDDENTVNLKEHKLIYTIHHTGKCLPLHVPKKGYCIHQNKRFYDAAISAASAVLGIDGFTIASAMTLGAYSQFCFSLLIHGHESFNVGKLANGLPDMHFQYFGGNTSHNGMVSSGVDLCLERRVCMNTNKMAIAQGDANGTRANGKHTESGEDFFTPHNFEALLKAWLKESGDQKKSLSYLKGEKMTLETFKAFATGVHSNRGSDNLSTVSFNRVNEMATLFARGQGNAGETRFDALNAFTEFYTSGSGVGDVKKVQAGKRFATANFGQGIAWKQTAQRMLCDDSQFDNACKRGEILYADKMLADSTAN